MNLYSRPIVVVGNSFFAWNTFSEYFGKFLLKLRNIVRSRRQIGSTRGGYIDTFKQRSNALGFDQKLLRLKYGQFLGEENESGIAINNEFSGEAEEHDHEEGHDHDHDHDHGGASEALQGARDLLSQFMHDHDQEEEAGL